MYTFWGYVRTNWLTGFDGGFEGLGIFSQCCENCQNSEKGEKFFHFRHRFTLSRKRKSVFLNSENAPTKINKPPVTLAAPSDICCQSTNRKYEFLRLSIVICKLYCLFSLEWITTNEISPKMAYENSHKNVQVTRSLWNYRRCGIAGDVFTEIFLNILRLGTIPLLQFCLSCLWLLWFYLFRPLNFIESATIDIIERTNINLGFGRVILQEIDFRWTYGE